MGLDYVIAQKVRLEQIDRFCQASGECGIIPALGTLILNDVCISETWEVRFIGTSDPAALQQSWRENRSGRVY